jgi:hypothetical protein
MTPQVRVLLAFMLARCMVVSSSLSECSKSNAGAIVAEKHTSKRDDPEYQSPEAAVRSLVTAEDSKGWPGRLLAMASTRANSLGRPTGGSDSLIEEPRFEAGGSRFLLR